MARAGAVAALVAFALALAVVAAEAPEAGERRKPRPVTGGSELYPNLRAVAELGRPGGRPTDAGVGVYPALDEPQQLAFPGPRAIEAARAYAAARRGRVAFAIADTRGGVAGLALDVRFRSASLTKAMILVARLDRAARAGRRLPEADTARLDAMIRVSDNESATSLFRRLGPGALASLARRAGLRSFSVGGDWGAARVTAADQVRFFLALDRLLPDPGRRQYARYLLSNVAPFHAWGIPRVARPRWRVYFKGGWRPDPSGVIVHQSALLERGPRRLAIAVLTDGNPGQPYGQETIRGVAARLLSRGRPPAVAARPGVLVPVGDLGGFRPPELRALHPLTRN